MTPATEDQLAEMIRGAPGPLAIRGGGSRGIAADGTVIETTGLSGVRLYEPGALTMVAGAGTPLADVEAALAAEGQMLAFEPFEMGAGGTIGGVFATNASGARRLQVGAARDFLLGVRFVDGSGEIVKNGGRVMKNVTGYDLVKLLAGSHGTLGVLSEVSFKVLPAPEATATLQISTGSDAAGLAAMTAAMATPYDVSGAVHLSGGEAGRTLLRIEGFAGSVRHRIDALTAALAPHGAVAEVESDIWARFRTLDYFDTAPAALWKVGIRPSGAEALVAELARAHRFSRAYDWAGGRIWIGAEGGDLAAFHAALQDAAAGHDAHATLMQSPEPLPLPRFQPEAPGVAALSAGLRAKFDPRGILNPGVMG